MQDQEPRNGLTRRTVLSAGALAGLLAALGLDVNPAPAYAAGPPQSALEVVTYARTYLGKTLAQMKPLVDAPWTGYTGDWCAWFVSWVTRGLGAGMQTWANHWDYLPSPSTPQVGDFARIGSSVAGGSAIHIGIVAQTNPIAIIDGNRMRNGATWYGNSWVQEQPAYSPMVLRRPTYLPSPPPTRRREMNYGVIKGSGVTVYVVRLADGAIRPLLAAEFSAFLSAGYTLHSVLDADIAALQAVAPAW